MGTRTLAAAVSAEIDGARRDGYRFPVTRALFCELITLGIQSRNLARELGTCLDFVRRHPVPAELNYRSRYVVADSRWASTLKGDDEVTERAEVMEQRRTQQAIHALWHVRFDQYHRVRTKLVRSLARARELVDEAADELDPSQVDPRDMKSLQVREVLGELGGSLGNHLELGDDPRINDESALQRLRDVLPKLERSTDSIRQMAHMKRSARSRGDREQSPNAHALRTLGSLGATLDRFRKALEATTELMQSGARRVAGTLEAISLSEITQELGAELARAFASSFEVHGVKMGQPPAGIAIMEADNPEGPWTPVPPGSVACHSVSVGSGGADATLMAALVAASKAVAMPTERHNAMNAISPGSSHQRWFSGEIIPRDVLSVIERASKLLELARTPFDASPAPLEEIRRVRRARRPRERSKADRVRELLSSSEPYEGTKLDLARAAGYTQPSSLENVKNFENLWKENERKLAELRAARAKRMANDSSRPAR